MPFEVFPRGLPNAISEGTLPMVLLHVSYEGLVLQITSSAALIFLLVHLNCWKCPPEGLLNLLSYFS